MEWPRVGLVGYINSLPVSYALEVGVVNLPAKICAHHPAELNRLLQTNQLEVAAVSSIEYARQQDSCLVLPALSISADGQVRSVALVSRVPMEELHGQAVSLTPHSATSIALLQILTRKFYRIEPRYFVRPAGSSMWWGSPVASLVIGDEALQAVCTTHDCYVYDLAAEWKRWTGLKMVFAIWVARWDFAASHPEQLSTIWQGLVAAKRWGLDHKDLLTVRGAKLTGLPPAAVRGYFDVLEYDLDWGHLEGLLYFFLCAREYGLLDRPAMLHIWGKTNVPYYCVQSA